MQLPLPPHLQQPHLRQQQLLGMSSLRTPTTCLIHPAAMRMKTAATGREAKEALVAKHAKAMVVVLVSTHPAVSKLASKRRSRGRLLLTMRQAYRVLVMSGHPAVSKRASKRRLLLTMRQAYQCRTTECLSRQHAM